MLRLAGPEPAWDELVFDISDMGRATLASFGIEVLDAWNPNALAATQHAESNEAGPGGPGGIRTHNQRIKSPLRCRCATGPADGSHAAAAGACWLRSGIGFARGCAPRTTQEQFCLGYTAPLQEVYAVARALHLARHWHSAGTGSLNSLHATTTTLRQLALPHLMVGPATPLEALGSTSVRCLTGAQAGCVSPARPQVASWWYAPTGAPGGFVRAMASSMPPAPSEGVSIELLWLLGRIWGDRPAMPKPCSSLAADEVAGVSRLGEQIRERRIGRGWPIVEVAARAGIPPTTWQRIERGEVEPSAVQIMRAAAALGTSVAALQRAALAAIARGPVGSRAAAQEAGDG